MRAPGGNHGDVRVVALGGGTGLPVVLRGLRETLFPPGPESNPVGARDRLTAIVGVADDGGSSGRLRRAYRVPPPGDIRNCLLALSSAPPDLLSIFGYRFNGHRDPGLDGHSLGNLILTALCQIETDFPRAVQRAGRVLGIRGRVLPATLDDVTLAAELSDGSQVEGESRIALAGRPIRRVRMRPARARACPAAVEAVRKADLIVLGPGSLYTSLIPILLVEGLAEAIARSRARTLLVMNLIAEPGETDGYTAGDVLLAVRRHAPRMRIDSVLVNSAPIPEEMLRPYASQGAAPIPANPFVLQALGSRPIARDLLASGPLVRHDPGKVARALMEVMTSLRPPGLEASPPRRAGSTQALPEAMSSP